MVHNKGELIVVFLSTPYSGKNDGLNIQCFISFSIASSVCDINKHVLQTPEELLCEFKLGLR